MRYYDSYHHAKSRRITPPERGDKSILHSTIQNPIQDPDSCAKNVAGFDLFLFQTVVQK